MISVELHAYSMLKKTSKVQQKLTLSSLDYCLEFLCVTTQYSHKVVSFCIPEYMKHCLQKFKFLSAAHKSHLIFCIVEKPFMEFISLLVCVWVCTPPHARACACECGGMPV
jgi:hypothetical protein